MNTEPKMEIKLIPNKENNTLTIQDTGVGMTKNDMITNLGTIARSGTKAFMEAIQAGADLSMIGQFGVGFYSAYLVADKVTVISKNNDDEQHVWESEAGANFTVRTDRENPIQLTRGTAIILHMKKDQLEFLEERTIKNLVKKHSEFIGFPIYLQVEKTEEKETENESATDANETEEQAVVVEDAAEENDKQEKKKVRCLKKLIFTTFFLIIYRYFLI